MAFRKAGRCEDNAPNVALFAPLDAVAFEKFSVFVCACIMKLSINHRG